MPSGEIFLEHEPWRKPLTWSAALHVAVAGLIILYSLVAHSGPGSSWGAGGGGGAIGVSLVSTVPLPASEVQTQNVLANESKGLSKTLPREVEKEPEAIPISGKQAKKKPKPVTTASNEKPQPAEEESNVAPFGEGGPVSGPYGAFNAGGAHGGFGFTGGGRDFGDRYAWYVRVVQQ